MPRFGFCSFPHARTCRERKSQARTERAKFSTLVFSSLVYQKTYQKNLNIHCEIISIIGMVNLVGQLFFLSEIRQGKCQMSTNHAHSRQFKYTKTGNTDRNLTEKQLKSPSCWIRRYYLFRAPICLKRGIFRASRINVASKSD